MCFPRGKPSIGCAQQIYCNPGDVIIYPRPALSICEAFIHTIDALPVPLHLDERQNFTCTPEQSAAHISPKTKRIILNLPPFPMDGVATHDPLCAPADVIRRQCFSDVQVYSEEIYANNIFDGQKHLGIASMPGMAKLTIISCGFPKSFIWNGGRGGYAVLPTVEEAGAFKIKNINFFSDVPPATERAPGKRRKITCRDSGWQRWRVCLKWAGRRSMRS